VPSTDEPDQPPQYEIVLTEPAEIDIDQAHAWLSELLSPHYADRWQDGLLQELQQLAYLPSRFAIAPENDVYDVTVRRLLYFGPTKRRKGSAYRVLFHIVDPVGDEAGIVRILHIWHGARKP
jgi:plasmid stabilization system protein ParE